MGEATVKYPNHIPLGFEQGDPCFVVPSADAARLYAEALGVRGAYLGPGARVAGLRFGRVVIFGETERVMHSKGPAYYGQYRDWVNSVLRPRLEHDGRLIEL